MSQNLTWPPSPAVMQSLLPAFDFTTVVTSSDFGIVFFANQKSLDRQVALKAFSPALAAIPNFRKDFETSSKLAARLRHTNLIGILDSGEVGGMLYLVMEFVPGKSLACSTQGQIIEFGQSLMIVDAICEGLAHAHDSELVHGHLDNLSILLNQNGVPKIGNFGLGRAVHTDPQVDVPLHFTAPEVLENPSAFTKASDVYSVATLFYEMVTGKLFSPHAPPLSSVCGCSAAVDSVLKRGTDPDPLERYSDAGAFQFALKQAVGAKKVPVGASATARPSPVSTLARPLPKAGFDSKLIVKITIIIVLLIAIFITWEIREKALTNYEREKQEILAKQKFAKDQAVAQMEEMKALEKPLRPVRPDRIPKESGIEERPADSLERLPSAPAMPRSEGEKAPKLDSTLPHGNTNVTGLDSNVAGVDSKVAELDSNVAELDSKVAELLLAAAEKRENEHNDNIKSLHWALGSYIRNLSSGGKAQFEPSVNAILKLVEDNRLKIEEIKDMGKKDVFSLSNEMLKLGNYHSDKQIQIDTQAEARIGKIRDAYVAKVTVIKDEAAAAGQVKVAADIQKLIKDAEDLDSWAESFGGK